VNGQGGFAGAALLVEERENPHGVIIATSHHVSKSCIDSVMALWRYGVMHAPHQDGILESSRTGRRRTSRPA
jgi:hypothetical protein